MLFSPIFRGISSIFSLIFSKVASFFNFNFKEWTVFLCFSLIVWTHFYPSVVILTVISFLMQTVACLFLMILLGLLKPILWVTTSPYFQSVSSIILLGIITKYPKSILLIFLIYVILNLALICYQF